MPSITIPGGIYLATTPGAAHACGTPYRFFPGPLRPLGGYRPVAPHTITHWLPDPQPQPLPVPEVEDSDFGAFMDAVGATGAAA